MLLLHVCFLHTFQVKANENKNGAIVMKAQNPLDKTLLSFGTQYLCNICT